MTTSAWNAAWNHTLLLIFLVAPSTLRLYQHQTYGNTLGMSPYSYKLCHHSIFSLVLDLPLHLLLVAELGDALLRTLPLLGAKHRLMLAGYLTN